MRTLLTCVGIILLVAPLARADVEIASADVEIASVSGRCPWTILVQPPAEGFPAAFDINKADLFDHSNAGYEYAAAHELADLIDRMIGARPAVIEVQNPPAPATYPHVIAIGRLALAMGAKPPESKFGVDGSVVNISPDRILLAGETPVASYYAMCRLAEMAGCRWYMPGELGEVIPRLAKIELKAGRFAEVPAVWSRMSGGPGDADGVRWALHNRLGGVEVAVGHMWSKVLPASKYFQAHPDWYALLDGKRVPGMLCTSNPAMIRQFISNYKEIIEAHPRQTWFSLSQDDGVDFCECPACRALDSGLPHPMAANLPEITDRLVSFYNQVVTELLKDYPDKYFTFYAYSISIAPPTRVKPHPHLMPIIAPIDFSRYHAISAHNSDSMPILCDYIIRWGKMCRYIGYYCYSFNLGDTLLPYTRETQAVQDMPFLVQNHLASLSMCCAGGYGQNQTPWFWLMYRLALDPEQNADVLLDDFYPKFFGPAADDMKVYMHMLRDAYAAFDYEVGNQWFAPLFFTTDFMEKADRLLTSAERQAQGNDVVTRRIAMWRFAYDCAQATLRMRMQTNAFQFQAASETANALYTSARDVLSKNPMTGHSYALEDWWKVFWKDPLDLCTEKLRGATIVHRFPDEWYAWVDHAGIGEAAELYRPDFPLTRWIKLKTYSQTISEQGLSRFRGTIWYRSSFDLGHEMAGTPLHILFGGFDSRIDLYVNGSKVGRRMGGWFDAADFDITRFVHAGENVVVCAVNNEWVTEIETGGIMRPVVVYAPARSQAIAHSQQHVPVERQ